MQWGVTHENFVREEYAKAVGKEVTVCGTRLHESGVIGATPDGIRSDGVLVEIKCPYGGRNLHIGSTLQKQAEILKKSGRNKKPKNTTFFFSELVLDTNGKPTMNTSHSYYDQVGSNCCFD